MKVNTELELGFILIIKTDLVTFSYAIFYANIVTLTYIAIKFMSLNKYASHNKNKT